MTVVVELKVDATTFELGRVLTVDGRAEIELEELVPLGEEVLPMFWLRDDDPAGFASQVRECDGVDDLVELDATTDRTLYAIDWDRTRDDFLTAIEDHGGYLLDGSGRTTEWTFHVRFPGHDALSTFGEDCQASGTVIEIKRLFNPTRPDPDERYGLTQAQYETLALAVRRDYYAIPREVSTKELAETLGISDQAVTERLRRAIVALAENTLLAPEDP